MCDLLTRKIITGQRYGEVTVPSSKSAAHRILISAALSKHPSRIICRGISKDIAATTACLNAMGADIRIVGDRICISPISPEKKKTEKMILPCGESGSTLRFLLPLAGALGLEADFIMEGRLPERPMAEYENVLAEHGMKISRKGNILSVKGQLENGEYSLPGNISSQYFTGLMISLPLLEGRNRIRIEGELESADYLQMTLDILRKSGIEWSETTDGYESMKQQIFAIPEEMEVEGDYSGAAFFLCEGALSEKGVSVKGLREDSLQGDKRIIDILGQFGAEVQRDKDRVFVRKKELRGIRIDASMIPDLIPVLSVVAAASEGSTQIINAERLRMKESDRIKSTVQMLKTLGADIEETKDGMLIRGRKVLPGGARVDSFSDHRIAMSAAVAASVCKETVSVTDPECVEKSYHDFWKELDSLEVSR